jgi:diguanylate cyclase (GGDEF)-like protein/PAS domain S-box-containing protein
MLQHVLQPHFDSTEVVASVVIAAIASYAALTLAARVGARRGRAHKHWIVGGGVAMGLGIAAMHFVGMVAMRLPVVVAYEAGTTILSVVVAIGASGLALGFAGGTTLSPARLAIGALMFGGAIVGMHYLGMSAIRAPVEMDHDLSRVGLSILVAIATAGAAVWLAFRLRNAAGLSGALRRMAAAVVMGFAVAGMHYTAMSAVSFRASSMNKHPFDGPLLEGHSFSASVIALSVVILVGAIIAAFVDQDARREARELQLTLEHRLAEHEAEAAMATQLYALLAEHATDMVSTHRPDGQFDYVTPSWSDFLGVPVSGVVGHVPLEFAHPDDVQLLLENHQRGLRSLTVITTVWRCRKAVSERDGSPRYAWLETTTRPVRETPTGPVQTFVCATRDVTERKRMEEQLARSEARFRAAIEGSFDGFLALEAVRNKEGTIIDFVYSELNPRAETLISRPRWQVIGRRMTDIFPSAAERYLEKLAGVVETRTPLEEEVEGNSPTGGRRWLHHQIIPLGDGVAITARDITDQKHAQEELRALTLVDELTGLYNRRGFLMLAEQHMRLIKRGGPASILVSIDLDGFKGVNDVYGHAEGDVALRRIANVLRIAFRDSDIIARFGGDEFVVLALDCGEMRDTLIERVMTALEADNVRAARPYSLSLSIGTARFDPFARVPIDQLMAEADVKLYEEKRRRTAARLSA